MTISSISSTQVTPQRSSPSSSVSSEIAAAVAGAKPGVAMADGMVPQSTIDAIAGIDVSQQKEGLFDSAATALGVSKGSYASAADYGYALSDKIEKMQGTSGGQAALAGISKKLGLDDLGVSLTTIANAIASPGGTDDQSVERGIRDRSPVEQQYFSSLARYLASEDDGTYSPNGAVAEG